MHLLLAFAAFLGVFVSPVFAVEWRTSTVVHVIDGDTAVLSSGEHVRFLDINAPEIAHEDAPADPFGNASAAYVTKLLTGEKVNLEVGSEPFDRYGRLLAHIYRARDGLWVNADILSKGLAVVYTFPGNATKADALFAKEAAARASRLGLWALPRWQVRDAARCCGASDMGLFMLVRGVPLVAGEARDRVYLNFGSDYRTDFTVEILRRDLKKYFGFKTSNDLWVAYGGKRLLVRGVLKPVNGALIRVSHPAQLEVLN